MKRNKVINYKKIVSEFVRNESYYIHKFYDGYIDFDRLVILLQDNLDKLVLKGGD